MHNKIYKAQFAIPGGFPTQEEAKFLASKNYLEHKQRIKNLGLTDSETKARRVASGISAAGTIITPVAPFIGYPMQIPAGLYDVEDYITGRDGFEHVLGDIAEPILYGVVKSTPTKLDDITLKTYPWLRNIASSLGFIDDVASAAGKDIYHDKNEKIMKSKSSSKLIRKNKK